MISDRNMQKDSRLIKTSAPSVAQINAEYVKINAEYVTQVSYDYFMKSDTVSRCICVHLLKFAVLCFCSLKLSNKYWAPHVKNKLPFEAQVR